MNSEVRDKWVEALRSGRYAQGQAQLRRQDDYCCLGVLCDLSGLGSWKRVGDNGYYEVGHDLRAGMPPDAVTTWAGLSALEANRLSVMNDEGRTFEAIAAHIAATL